MPIPKANHFIGHDDARKLAVHAAKALQPRTPITTKELFAGRWNELTTLADAVNQQGLHAVIYGERGVGKTSLANVVRPTISALDSLGPAESALTRIVLNVNTNSGDTFGSIWEKLLSEITWGDDRPAAGLLPTKRSGRTLREAFRLPDVLGIDDVRRILSGLVGSVFIIDEFDRAAKDTSRHFTDLVKCLSDFAIDATIILVGVSETVDQLVSDHASINRSIIQVPLPRMEAAELKQILSNAEKSLGITFSEESKNLIVHISQGLPHYTHLIGLHSVRKALNRFSTLVEREDVFAALKEAVKQAQQTVTEKHIKATHSSHKEALYRHVLLGCALTAARSHDALGYFNPGSIVEPLKMVLGRPVEIATFNSHLTEFCQDKRGNVLERTGQPRAYRYRFHDPLLVPFVLMDALAGGLLTNEELGKILGGSTF